MPFFVYVNFCNFIDLRFSCFPGASPGWRAEVRVKKIVKKITKKIVDEEGAQPSEREFAIWDSELKGFGLRVRPSGARSYVVVYRPIGEGRKAAVRRVTLGAVGKITPDEARRIARKVLGSVAHGDDPAADRAQERRAATFKEIAELFLAEHVVAKRKPVNGDEISLCRLGIHHSDVWALEALRHHARRCGEAAS